MINITAIQSSDFADELQCYLPSSLIRVTLLDEDLSADKQWITPPIIEPIPSPVSLTLIYNKTPRNCPNIESIKSRIEKKTAGKFKERFSLNSQENEDQSD